MVSGLASFRPFTRVAKRKEVAWDGTEFWVPVIASVTEVYLRGAGGLLVWQAFDSYSAARLCALDHVGDCVDGCAWVLLHQFNPHPRAFWFEPVQATVFFANGEKAPASVELFERWLHLREVPSRVRGARSVDPPRLADSDFLEPAADAFVEVGGDFKSQCAVLVRRSLAADAERIARGVEFVPPWAEPGARRWDGE